VQTYAVLHVMDRLMLINSRFGAAIGDHALRKFKDFIMLDAHPEDLFFRWGGPAFLALVQRVETIDWMRRAVARTVSEKCEITVETETRGLMLPLSSRWTVFPMFAAPRILIAKLDAFTSA
jgi:GGDEF domain-containing protein